jgi:hypothetical protein
VELGYDVVTILLCTWALLFEHFSNGRDLPYVGMVACARELSTETGNHSKIQRTAQPLDNYLTLVRAREGPRPCSSGHPVKWSPLARARYPSHPLRTFSFVSLATGRRSGMLPRRTTSTPSHFLGEIFEAYAALERVRSWSSFSLRTSSSLAPFALTLKHRFGSRPRCWSLSTFGI